MSRIDYSKIQVEDFLNQLGMHNVRRDGKEVFFSCPFEGHNHGDLNPSASMQSGTTKVHCFGCGFSGNALTFLAEYENVSPLKAARFIREYVGDEFKEPEGSFAAEINEKFNSIPERVKQQKRNEPINVLEVIKRKIDWHKSWTDGADSPEHWLFDRGFHWEALENWDIGWDEISRRFTIPWFDEYGNPIGFKGRALDHEVGNGNARYKVLGGSEYAFDTFDVSMMLYGLQNFDSSIWPDFNNNQLLVVEGELNVVALAQMEIGPALGISGKYLSDEQVYMLSKFDRELIMCFDDINDAKKAADKLIGTNRVSILPEHDKDPADSTPDEVRDLLSRRQNAIIT